MSENVREAQRLKSNQLKAVAALLTSPDMAQAAKAAGVSRDTLYEWLKQPAFRAALREAERSALDAGSRELVRIGSKAVGVVEGVLDSTTATDHVRLRASEIALGRVLQFREMVTLEERVAELERAMRERGLGDAA